MNTVESRAHWQRSEGMVIFDHAVREELPHSLQAVTDDQIIDILASEDYLTAEGYSTHDVVNVAHRLASVAFQPFPRANNYDEDASCHLETVSIAHRMGQYLYRDYYVAKREGFKSALHFPLNLIAHAHILSSSHAERFRADALGVIASTYRQSWFQTACEEAAFTANGVWGNTSNIMSENGFINMSDAEHPLFRPMGPTLRFEATGDSLMFGWSHDTLQKFRDSIAERNRNFNYNKRRGDSVIDNDKQGTTSGCPVRYARPSFADSQTDANKLTQLSQLLGKTPAEISHPRPESAIVFSLNCIADYYDRAQQIGYQLLTSSQNGSSDSRLGIAAS